MLFPYELIRLFNEEVRLSSYKQIRLSSYEQIRLFLMSK